MRTDTIAVRDRILAALREADKPLTTAEVCEAAGSYLQTREHADWRHREPYASSGYYQIVSCDGATEIISLALNAGQRGWRELARFERLGLVVAARAPSSRTVLWSLVDREPDPQIEALELLLSDGATS